MFPVRTRRSLSLRAKLTASFVGLSLVAIVGVTVTLTMAGNRQAVTALRDKATSYAKFLTPQLRPVIAFNDKLTAREVFEAFSADPDVSGLAVYTVGGELIDGYGAFPREVERRAAAPVGRVVVLTPVVSPEGPRGTLYVSISTAALERRRRDSALGAVAVGVLALLMAIPMAALLAKPVAARVGTIASAAAVVAEGHLDQPDLAPGADDEIGRLARGFNVMVAELRRQFVERADQAASEQARLASLVATRTQELEESREQYRLVAESTNAIPFTYLPEAGRFVYVGPQAETRLAHPLERWKHADFLDTLVARDDLAAVRAHLQAPTSHDGSEFECTAVTADGHRVQLRWVVAFGEIKGEPCLRGLILDISDQRRLERDLAQAQKLESVGRLAAGVAHEINTPLQFVSDSIEFLRGSMQAFLPVIASYRRLKAGTPDIATWPARVADVTAAEDAADVDYMLQQMPDAIHDSLDGLDRVTTIVRSLKIFAHPDQQVMHAVDINQSIQSTLVMARNEYKYVADIESTLGDLPPVICHGGDLSQVVLNVIVNAAHAVADVVAGTGTRGRITVTTVVEGDFVAIRIGDTGGGIPEAIRDRIFEPFFTTKDIGKGTGQGLAIARSIVTEKHDGEFTFESECGRGTTFTIRLPIRGRLVAAAA